MTLALATLAILLAGALWLLYRTRIQLREARVGADGLRQRATNAEPVQDGLPQGSVVPDFELPLLTGGRARLSHWRGREILVIFFSPECSHSLRLTAALYKMGLGRMTEDPVLLVVSTGDPKKNRRLFERHPIAARVLLQESTEVATLCRVRGTPMGYWIDRNGKTISDVMIGNEWLALTLAIPGKSVSEVELSPADTGNR